MPRQNGKAVWDKQDPSLVGSEFRVPEGQEKRESLLHELHELQLLWVKALPVMIFNKAAL